MDFGVGTKITLSNGAGIDFELRETSRLKRLQRNLARAKKGSRNRKRVQFLLRKEYEKLSNRRKDAQNQAIRLYNANVSDRLSMSGDHGRNDYDEVNVMKRFGDGNLAND